jgi:hypothetical protein
MTNQQPPELFSERPVQSNFARADVARMRSYRIRRIITCCVVAMLLAGGIYCIMRWNRGPAEIPTIKAETALKQKPEQPGGIDIPNQDVLAYQQIDNSGGKPPTEHLLPPPEAPQPAHVAPPAPAAPLPSAPSIETLIAPPVPQVMTTVMPHNPPSPPAAIVPAPVAETAAPPSPPPPAPATAAIAAPAVSVPTVTSVPPASAPPPVNAETPAADEGVTKPVAGKKTVRIQLASFPDKETAEEQLASMERKYAGQLGAAKLHLTKADLGARGIYWRVQSNPLAESDARDLCAAIKNLKGGCILVKP